MFGESVVDTHRGVSVHSCQVEEARIVGGAMFYPHTVEVLGPESRFALHINGIDLGAMVLGWLWWDTGVQINTAELEDAYQLNIPIHGSLQTSSGDERMVATPSRGAVYRHDRPTTMRGWCGGHERVLAVKICRAAAEAHLSAMLNRPITDPIQFDLNLDLTDAASAQWVSLLRDLAIQLHRPQSVSLHPLMAQSLAASVMTGLMLGARHNYTDDLIADSSRTRTPTIQRAVDYIEEHLGEPLEVSAIAGHAHLSVRALQEGFQSALGTTPMRYVREARLQRARTDLRTATGAEGVAEIAFRWGFTHLGRFSSMYRQAFGESPSAALQARDSHRIHPRQPRVGQAFRGTDHRARAMLS
ncbi:AraC family transcriptional regulator [Mycolicibacterium phocaicum]|uniref:AraC family transcriptional regulator n=1 Tax=Mycolicibacterium phocaicum TaxID=319706 RepID=A0A7I7ZWL7_9MYCO|nr:AraC family transcriptional regulator [Mycolicibacterium phocaicum]TLH64008.1 AraC family transcriptional regulator [Mycolicibacterium phocaicum]BBZ58132.1 AraC family transcriptional regulator [Mycolicibacterium phocaicum]